MHCERNGAGRRGQSESAHRGCIVNLERLGDAAFLTTDSHMSLRWAICGLNACVSLSSVQGWNSKVFHFKISFSSVTHFGGTFGTLAKKWNWLKSDFLDNLIYCIKSLIKIYNPYTSNTLTTVWRFFYSFIYETNKNLDDSCSNLTRPVFLNISFYVSSSSFLSFLLISVLLSKPAQWRDIFKQLSLSRNETKNL